MSTSENDKEIEEEEEEKEEEGKRKISSAKLGAECLGFIVNLKYPRVKLFNHNTAYDAYMDFLTEAKEIIPIGKLREAFPHQKGFATHEMILTPSFVCFLAMRKLRRMLELEDLPRIEDIPDAQMKIKTKSDKNILAQNPKDKTIFHPQSRDNIPGELQEFARTILNEIAIKEKFKSV